MNKIKLAFITPVSCLDYTKEGDILYVLTHMLHKSEYYDYIKNSSMYKIIDNSVHEGAEITEEQFYEYCFDLKCDEVILQDVMDDFVETSTLKESQLDKYYSKLHEKDVKIMGVLQGLNIEQIESMYRNYMDDKRIDVIGISFTTIVSDFVSEKYLNQFLNRRLILGTVQKINEELRQSKPVHLLGANSWLEATYKTNYSFIRSHDTKLLARIANNNQTIEDYIVGKPTKKLTLHEIFTKEQNDCLIYNIQKIKKIVENYEKNDRRTLRCNMVSE